MAYNGSHLPKRLQCFSSSKKTRSRFNAVIATIDALRHTHRFLKPLECFGVPTKQVQVLTTTRAQKRKCVKRSKSLCRSPIGLCPGGSTPWHTPHSVTQRHELSALNGLKTRIAIELGALEWIQVLGATLHARNRSGSHTQVFSSAQRHTDVYASEVKRSKR
jgi:hypothetical protein